MDRIKKNIKRIWNSNCKYLIIVACALILANGVNLLQTSLKFLNKKGEIVEEVKSIFITSKTWDSKDPGSWKIEKSAEWTGVKKATITFDVETLGKESGQEKDVVLVLDYSLSMNGKKITQLKEDTSELVDFLLTETDNQVALITFNGPAIIQSGFTHDKNKVINLIENTDTAYGTNYTNALVSVEQLLSNYQSEKDRNLIVIFLTDGHPIEGNGVAQYSLLKEKYPFIIINGIQYEMGSGIINAIKNVSDKQYIASKVNLRDVFFESIGAKSYETFEIVDYISDDFYVNHVSDIRVSRGKVKLEEAPDGRQKITWALAGNDLTFITSFGATMEIDVIFKGEVNPDKIFKTNEKEEIKTKLSGEGLEDKESEETPQLRGGYTVTYNPNLPSECNPSGTDMTVIKAYFPYEKVDRNLENYTCSGWQIQEWKIDGTVPDLGGDKFDMPPKDTKVTAIWTKMDISKKMEGTIFDVYKQDLVEAMIENAETSVNLDTSINFGAPSSETNGRGLYIRSGTENDTNPIYYYRGVVENNHVLFASICWQIVRTTETGGIKLIYNGVSVDGKTCNTVEGNNIGSSQFNTTDTFGYMYNGRMNSSSVDSSNYLWRLGKSFEILSGNVPKLQDSVVKANPGPGYHYACGTSQTITCSGDENKFMRYLYSYAGKGKPVRYIRVGSSTIEQYMENVFLNSTSSSIKSTIDNWYKTNIEDRGYTKYLDINTVWCNDRTMTSGPLYSHTANFGETLFAATSRRMLNTTSANPEIKESTACSNSRDRFTTSSANTGNKALTYPVGTLTADEVILGGLTFNTASQDSYLSSGNGYWTMTPYKWPEDDIYGQNYSVSSSGQLTINRVNASNYVRPSISLKPGTLVYGIGTKDDPYEVITR